MYSIRHYLTADGRYPFMEWQKKLRDRVGRQHVLMRINRIKKGNFGNRRYCRNGVWELKIDYGPGYRVYCTMTQDMVVLLLCGGDKSTQDTDIARAVEYCKDWQRRLEK